LLIREGRHAAQKLVSAIALTERDDSRLDSVPADTEMPTLSSTVLEKDFTVEGKKGALACPFSKPSIPESTTPPPAEQPDILQDSASNLKPQIPHSPSDPICAALLDPSLPSASSPSKCPIRFLDKHSPEEIARYVEAHKHKLPRSHEVCLRRYQRNEEQIRKLDAKYGNLVNMVRDLSQLHRPMLPQRDSDEDLSEKVKASAGERAKRVEEWTKGVEPGVPGEGEDKGEVRESRFDRPLREVRVGESPSRPWGISVPVSTRREPSVPRPVEAGQAAEAPRKCPFDHTKLGFGESEGHPPSEPKPAPQPQATPSAQEQPQQAQAQQRSSSTPQPTFITMPDPATPASQNAGIPQIVFNISGPVFIGYSMEQAIEFMAKFYGQAQAQAQGQKQ